MNFVKFSVVAELGKAVSGRKTKVGKYELLQAIAGMLGLSNELKRR